MADAILLFSKDTPEKFKLTDEMSEQGGTIQNLDELVGFKNDIKEFKFLLEKSANSSGMSDKEQVEDLCIVQKQIVEKLNEMNNLEVVLNNLQIEKQRISISIIKKEASIEALKKRIKVFAMRSKAIGGFV